MDKNRPFRLTRGKLSWELSLFVMAFIWSWRLFTWGFRRIKPVAYHPVAMIGITVVVLTFAISPWLTVLIFLALPVALSKSDNLLDQIFRRTRSFLAGFRYRHRPRRKLGSMGLLNDQDPVPTVSYVQKIGCTTKVRIKMSHGDEIEDWRLRSARLAQTYKALDCKINPYRRYSLAAIRPDGFTRRPPFIRHHFSEPPAIQPHWLVLEFLTKDPFIKVIGPEYIEFYRDASISLPEEGNPVGPYRDGSPHRFLVRTHKLVVAPSQRGKSNAERVMVYADHKAVQARLVENWGCDLKRGVEIKFMEGQFTRTEYGLDGPEMVARFFEDAQAVMNRRLDAIREAGEEVRHIPVLGDPALRIYIDEFLAFEDTEYNNHRSRIYRAISAIQRRGAAAGVSIIAFAQDPKKEKFPLRDGFLEVEVGGGLTRTQCEMVMPGAWEMGVRTTDVDLPGVFYVKSENDLMPEQFRYVHITNATIKGLPKRPDTAFEKTPEEKKDIVGVLIA